MRHPPATALLLFGLLAAAPVVAADEPADKVGKMAHLEFSVAKHWVRVECEAMAVNAPLEFFCCLNGTNEHESVLRSAVRPSDLHTALLAIGLKPGEPMTYSESLNKWFPPHGPPLRITVEFTKDGKTVTYPAYRWLREVKSHKECPSFSWVFCGSRTKEGRYAADDTGYIVSIVNFDFAVIDIPSFASSNNDLLEWERNADLMPAKGTPVWMVIEPLGADAGAAPSVVAGADAAVSPPCRRRSFGRNPPFRSRAGGTAEREIGRRQGPVDERISPADHGPAVSRAS